MEATDFTKDMPGRLVPTIEGALAYVPNPLPGAHDLQIDVPTMRLLALADNALGELKGATQQLVNPWLVASPLLYGEAILSSRIEGTIASPDDVIMLEAGERPAAQDERRMGDTLEVLNYVRAMRYGLERIGELPLCLRLFRELHSKLLSGVRGAQERPGEFRRSQNWIGPYKGAPISEARFFFFSPDRMHEALEELEECLHAEARREIPLLIELALLHYQFETIHPFRDGNGRIGRLLIPLILCERNRLPSPLLYVSSFLDRHKEQYCDLMLKVSQTGDWLSWIRFFLTAVKTCCRESIEQARGLMELRDSYHQRLQTARSSALLIKLIDQLFSQPSTRIRAAAELLGVTPAAASNNIRKLVEAGILEKASSRKRNQVFVASEIRRFLRDRNESRQ